jgi:hypothetical protein
MHKTFAQHLKRYLIENFPHLSLLWGREKLEEFIIARSVLAIDRSILTGHQGPFSHDNELRINTELFKGKVLSPFNLVRSVIARDFPRFHQKLATQQPEVRLRILIELTILYSPSGFLAVHSEEDLRAGDYNTNISTHVARYLHGHLMSSAHPPAV